MFCISFGGKLACDAAPLETDQLTGTVEIQRQAEGPVSTTTQQTSGSSETAQPQESSESTESTSSSSTEPSAEQPAAETMKVEPQKAVLLAPAKSTAAKGNAFKEANELIKQRKYSEALGVLSTVQPQTELWHYYTALCYQYLNQMAKAKSEYMWVYSNGKNPQLKANAAIAYTQISQYQARRTYSGQGNTFARVNYGYPPAPRVTFTSGPG